MNMNPIPLIDLEAAHAPIRDRLAEAVARVVTRGEFCGGIEVAGFERDFADYCGTRHAIGVGSGTDALWLALAALGVGPGDEVVTVSMTFFATAEAIARTGATPVLVDIDPLTYTMDPERLAEAVTRRTKAIVPVHLFGQTAAMEGILEIAAAHGVPVVEDAAQAHGALHAGRRAGAMGAAGCFSFYPSKNLGAFGEAGAVVTDDDRLAAEIRMLRDHGQRRKYEHLRIGWNCRMDAVQAAVLGVKLAGLDAANRSRADHAKRYLAAWRETDGLAAPQHDPRRGHVHHLHVVRVPDRQRFVRHLDSRAIGWGIHYPVPVHLQPVYAGKIATRGTLPVTESCAREFVSLPMHPALDEERIGRVVAAVREALSLPVRARPPAVRRRVPRKPATR